MTYKIGGERPSGRLKAMGVTAADSTARYAELERLVGLPELRGPLTRTYRNNPVGKLALARVGPEKLAPYVRTVLDGAQNDDLGKPAPTRKSVLAEYPVDGELRNLMEKDVEIREAVEGSTVHLVSAVHQKRVHEANRSVPSTDSGYYGAI